MESRSSSLTSRAAPLARDCAFDKSSVETAPPGPDEEALGGAPTEIRDWQDLGSKSYRIGSKAWDSELRVQGSGSRSGPKILDIFCQCFRTGI